MGLKFDGFKISIKGKHKQRNQDYAVVKKLENTLVCVVCDGLGSKQLSHLGARALAKSVVEIVAQNIFDRNNLANNEALLDCIYKRKLKGLNLSQCASTLLCGILYGDKAYFGHVGDGAIAIFGNENYLIQQPGEFSNITTPFGSKNMEWLELDSSNIHSVVLCSDGVSEIFEDLSNFLQEYINEYKTHTNIKARNMEILSWLNEFKGFCDDKSIVAIWSNI